MAARDLAPGDDDTPTETARQTLTFPALLQDLCRKRTGWLGWSKETTLDAPRRDHRSDERPGGPLAHPFDGKEANPAGLKEKFRTAFAAIGTTIVKRSR